MSLSGKFWTGYLVIFFGLVFLLTGQFGCAPIPKKEPPQATEKAVVETWSADSMTRMSCVYQEMYNKEVSTLCVSVSKRDVQ